jgi:SprT-like family
MQTRGGAVTNSTYTDQEDHDYFRPQPAAASPLRVHPDTVSSPETFLPHSTASPPHHAASETLATPSSSRRVTPPITREAWLQEAVKRLHPWFAARGHQLPVCQVSCGFASTGVRSGHIGQCWSSKSSPGGVNQIFISPALIDPVEVLDTLVHELVHAVDDCEHKHGKEFRKIALSVGLVGPMRGATAGPDLKMQLGELAPTLARDIGPYPHEGLTVPRKKRRQTQRPQARCSECGFTVPMLKKFLHVGPPLCPVHRTDMTPLGEWDAC